MPFNKSFVFIELYNIDRLCSCVGVMKALAIVIVNSISVTERQEYNIIVCNILGRNGLQGQPQAWVSPWSGGNISGKAG